MTTNKSFLQAGISAYIDENSPQESPLLRELREYTNRLPMSVMQISAQQGQLMSLLAKSTSAQRYLEIGTFTGYSSLVMAQAMPEDSELHCCDNSEEWTQVARKYWAKAGVESRMHLHLDNALVSLNSLLRENKRFDIAFIDADKENYRQYFDLCMRLVRPGGLILIDNTLWSGKVADYSCNDKDTKALRQFNQYLATVKRVTMSFLPVADGLTMVYKNS